MQPAVEWSNEEDEVTMIDICELPLENVEHLTDEEETKDDNLQTEEIVEIEHRKPNY